MLKRHPLVKADLRAAFDWYEDKTPGLGLEWIEDFRNSYRRLKTNPAQYSIRFADVRRINFSRFPYGIFYTIRTGELWIIAVLHARRDSEAILTARRGQ